MNTPLFLPVTGGADRATKIFSRYQETAFNQNSTSEKLSALKTVSALAYDYFVGKGNAYYEVKDSPNLNVKEFALKEAIEAMNIAKKIALLYKLMVDAYCQENPKGAQERFQLTREEKAYLLLNI